MIFLTMTRITEIDRRGIYTDVLRKFRGEGWGVYIVAPNERGAVSWFKFQASDLVHFYDIENTSINGERGSVHILGVKTLNLQKTSTIEKGIGQVLVDGQYKRAIKRYLPDVQFDLILYSTPPVTFQKVIAYLKKSNSQAKTYLLLKDIFPQNAVDIGLMSTTGLKGFLYCYFRCKERRLYALSDYIGCMSPANVKYVLAHNPEVDVERVEVAPNSVEILNTDDTNLTEKRVVRERYGLPVDKPIFIYGGNLGKPQGIPFLIDCLEANSNRDDCFFLVIGTGTELPKLMDWYVKKQPKSVKVMKGLPKAEYDELVRSCDVGLIFLDHRFTIPNYPSRLLSYLENKMPVLCAIDPNTDMGRIAEENGYGYWCESNSVDVFTAMVDKMIRSDREAMGKKGYWFLCGNYRVENTYDAIVKHL